MVVAENLSIRLFGQILESKSILLYWQPPTCIHVSIFSASPRIFSSIFFFPPIYYSILSVHLQYILYFQSPPLVIFYFFQPTLPNYSCIFPNPTSHLFFCIFGLNFAHIILFLNPHIPYIFPFFQPTPIFLVLTSYNFSPYILFYTFSPHFVYL